MTGEAAGEDGGEEIGVAGGEEVVVVGVAGEGVEGRLCPTSWVFII